MWLAEVYVVANEEHLDLINLSKKLWALHHSIARLFSSLSSGPVAHMFSWAQLHPYNAWYTFSYVQTVSYGSLLSQATHASYAQPSSYLFSSQPSSQLTPLPPPPLQWLFVTIDHNRTCLWVKQKQKYLYWKLQVQSKLVHFFFGNCQWTKNWWLLISLTFNQHSLIKQSVRLLFSTITIVMEMLYFSGMLYNSPSNKRLNIYNFCQIGFGVIDLANQSYLWGWKWENIERGMKTLRDAPLIISIPMGWQVISFEQKTKLKINTYIFLPGDPQAPCLGPFFIKACGQWCSDEHLESYAALCWKNSNWTDLILGKIIGLIVHNSQAAQTLEYVTKSDNKTFKLQFLNYIDMVNWELHK